MTLRTLISFDHALLTGSYSLTIGTTYASNPLNTVYGVPGAMITSNSNGGASISNTGWLAMGLSYSNVNQGYVVSLADLNLFQNGATQAWFGFRTYATGSGANVSTVGVLASSTNGSNGSNGANITPLITETQIGRPGWGAANSSYCEVFLDIGNNVYSAYVNGVQIVNQAALPTGIGYIIFAGAMFSNSYGQYYRDFYFLDVDSTKPNGRLGPITSTPLNPTVKSALNYQNFAYSITGGMAISTTVSKFGGGSLGWTSASNGYVQIPPSPLVVATGDITYDFWINPNNVTQSSGLFGKDANAAPWGRCTWAANVMSLYADQTSSTPFLTANLGLVAGVWAHLAVVRYQGTWSIYVNGVLVGSAAGGTLGNGNVNWFTIGNTNAANASLQGYIDEFRITQAARWTAPFTPPTQSAVVDANTALLMRFDASVNSMIADSGIQQVSALSTAQAASFAMTPFLQNSADNQPLSLNFAPTAVTGQKIVAMQYKMAAQVPFAINMLASLNENSGASVKTLSPYLFRDTVANYGRDLAGVQALAPDGNAWSIASLAATNLILQPQSTTAGAAN
jgi:hypothetical protein